jgi:hypothetical protein
MVIISIVKEESGKGKFEFIKLSKNLYMIFDETLLYIKCIVLWVTL